MANNVKLYNEQSTNIGEWIEFMKTRLDRYEVERNEFTADYRMPPKNVMFYREVILPFAENTLIMDNLTASEGIRYNDCGCKNKLRIRCFIDGQEIKATYPNLKCLPNSNCKHKDDCTNICYPDFFPYLVQSKKGESLENAFNNKIVTGEGNVDDFEICLPSEHAFYSILENFIRNSAKHNKKHLEDEDKSLEIYISVFEKDDNLYEVNLYDNVSTMPVEKLYGLVEGKRQSLLNEAGQLKREKLGIVDMKINAHLLRSSLDIEDELLKKHLEIILLPKSKNNEFNNWFCTNKNQIPSLIGTEVNADDNGQSIKDVISNNNIEAQPLDTNTESKKEIYHYRFGYRFHFAKSKKVCWIGKVNEQATALKKQGIYLFKDWKEFKKQKDSTLAAFQFTILELGVLKDWTTLVEEDKWKELEDELENMLLRLPFRVLLNSTEKIEKGSILKDYTTERRRIQQVEEPIISKNGKDAAFNILKSCWKNWLRRWINNDKTCLYLSLDDYTNWGKLNKIINGEGNNNKVELSSNIHLRKYQNNNEFNSYKHVIIYDHHGIGLKKSTDNPISFDTGFYQIIEKGSEDYVPIFYPPKDENDRILLCFELIEAGLCNIIVVDERLCDKMYDKDIDKHVDKLIHCYKTITCAAHRAAWANLWLSNEFESKKSISLNGNEESKRKIFSCTIKNGDLSLSYWDCKLQDKKMDAIVIHRTYLDNNNLPSMGNNNENKKLIEYLTKLRKNIPLVIVISGGGYPHGLTGKFKYKPYGAYQRYFSPSISKYSIVRTTLT